MMRFKSNHLLGLYSFVTIYSAGGGHGGSSQNNCYADAFLVSPPQRQQVIRILICLKLKAFGFILFT